MSRSISIALVLALSAPAIGTAQQAVADLPQALFVSQWQCAPGNIGEITQVYDSLIRPVEQELVNEGRMYGAGMFFHDWGDEWNVNWYRLGMDRAQVFDAVAEVGRRIQQRHPEAPNPLQSCTAHRDNIYRWGPRTAPPEAP